MYHFRIRNRTTLFNAANSGGSLRFSILYQELPQADDLYLPAGGIGAFREGQMVNVQSAFVDSKPTGVAIDYTLAPMDNLNGGTHSAVRLLVGLHDFELVEVLDLITLNNGEAEIDFIGDPWSVPLVNTHPATLYVTASGTLYVGWFGNGYLFVAGDDTLPAYLDAVSNNPSYSAIKSISATSGDTQSTAPFTDTEIVVGIDNIAPWAITVDEASGTIYYIDGGFYLPVGGQTIKRWSLASGQLSDFATIVAPVGSPDPGLKGLQLLPDGGLLVCNSSEVVRLNSSGGVVQTYTPTLPVLASRCLIDVKLTSNGQAFWVVDLDSQLTKFNLDTGAQLLTVQNYLVDGALTQMAIYQPTGIIIEPPEPEPEPEPEPIPDCPAILIDDPVPGSALARLFRVHTSPRRAIDALPLALEGGFSGVLGDSSFGALMLGGMGAVGGGDSDDCLTIAPAAPRKPTIGRFKVQ